MPHFNAVCPVFTSSFPNNYWDKFVKRKVGGLCHFHLISRAHNLVTFTATLSSSTRLGFAAILQVIKKYGDLYGAERIAELLGLDKSALDFNPTEETVAKEASLVSW